MSYLPSLTRRALRLAPLGLGLGRRLRDALLDVRADGADVRRYLLHLDARRALEIAQLLEHLLPRELQVLPRVLVLVLGAREVRVQLILRAPPGAELRVRQLVVQLEVETESRLVRPQPRDVSGRVPAAAEDEQRESERFDKVDAGPVRLDVEVEAAEAVAAEGVGAALEDDCAGAVGEQDGLGDALEEEEVAIVVDAVFQGHVEAVVAAVAGADVFEPACAGEELLRIVLVEGEGHDAVGGPEGLFDAVAVVDVDVDVEDARVVAEQLEDGQDDVIDVAEAGRLRFLSVVQAAAPVDGDVGLAVDELAGAVEGGAGVDAGKVEEAVKDGAVVADVVLLDDVEGELVGVVRGDALEEGEVVGAVEVEELGLGGAARDVHVHELVEAVAEDELVGEGQAPGLHRVGRAEVVFVREGVVVVGDLRRPLSQYEMKYTRRIVFSSAVKVGRVPGSSRGSGGKVSNVLTTIVAVATVSSTSTLPLPPTAHRQPRQLGIIAHRRQKRQDDPDHITHRRRSSPALQRRAMASFAPIEDVQSVLEQFIENVSNLPAEVAHLYEELGNKDKRVHALKQNIAQKDASIQRFIRANGSHVPHPKEAQYNRAISEAFKEIATLQDEKCKLSRRANELIEKHVKRLDMKIRDLQRDGLLPEDFITPAMLAQHSPPNVAASLTSSSAVNATSTSSNGNGIGAANGVTVSATPGRLQPALTGAARSSGGGGGMSTASTLEGVSRTLAAASMEDQLVHSLKTIVSPAGPDAKRRRLNTGGPAPVNPSPLANASTANSGINTPTRGVSAASQGQSASARRSGPPPKPVRRPTTSAPVVKKQKNEDDMDEDHSDSDNDDEEEDTGEDQKPYCVCQQVSFGNMVACDNKSCPYEWFHWGCVGLTKEPAGSWFCDHCTKLKQQKGGPKKE
ncbi:Chromatin modification-related protein png1 [Drechslerella dactyloides]|uniref:Chromatin modification-related protein n=1 Tax=Drechslerella dactyloides TaxID=74499 RepID=A0AAD6NP73_DREDA|nr:Chromatin modification-related protein png1 [Drechslerella dactyloides]